MRGFIFTLLSFTLCQAGLFAAEYKAAGGLFVVDFESGWTEAKSNDPAAVLRLEKGKDFFEIVKLEDELSDYYLKARVKEQAENLKQKGLAASEVRTTSIHSVAAAYYITYSQNYQTKIIAFFTYQGVSYSINSSGVGENAFKDLAYFFRKPGEKVEVKRPRPIVKRKRVVEKQKKDNTFEELLSTSATTFISAAVGAGQDDFHESTETPAAQVSSDSVTRQIDEAKDQAGKWFSDLAARTSRVEYPYVRRNALNKYLSAALIILWFALSFVFRGVGARIPNPKMTPYPQDVPPDFFFPFIITRVSTFKETMFQIITRQKQVLSAYYSHEHALVLNLGIYGFIFFHVFWSISGFINEDLVTGALLSLPLGRFLASIPELPFLLLFAWGMFKRMKIPWKLTVQDSQSNLLVEVLPGKDFYAIVKDGKGMDVARLHKRGMGIQRQWHFCDLDNHVLFTVIDEHPNLFVASKFFGSQGGKLRARYGLFVDNKRVGFLFVDPNSRDGFQVHLEFDYARVAHPAHVLAALLCIISKEKEGSLLSL